MAPGQMNLLNAFGVNLFKVLNGRQKCHSSPDIQIVKIEERRRNPVSQIRDSENPARSSPYRERE